MGELVVVQPAVFRVSQQAVERPRDVAQMKGYRVPRHPGRANISASVISPHHFSTSSSANSSAWTTARRTTSSLRASPASTARSHPRVSNFVIDPPSKTTCLPSRTVRRTRPRIEGQLDLVRRHALVFRSFGSRLYAHNGGHRIARSRSRIAHHEHRRHLRIHRTPRFRPYRRRPAHTGRSRKFSEPTWSEASIAVKAVELCLAHNACVHRGAVRARRQHHRAAAWFPEKPQTLSFAPASPRTVCSSYCFQSNCA